MNCGEFEKIVHDLARPDALDDATAVMGKFHAQMCAHCAARLAQAQVLALALDSAAQDAAELDVPSHLESALVSAFREHHRGLARGNYRQQRSRWRWFEWSSLATAAVVLLAIGAWNFARPRTANILGSHASRQGTALIHPDERGAVPGHVPNPEALAPEANSASSGSQNEMAGTAGAQSDATTDFVPVPFGESFGPGDSGVIVRVEMPRSALADLGYSVDATRSADLVQADLLVGEDGWPRAVRLVP